MGGVMILAFVGGTVVFDDRSSLPMQWYHDRDLAEVVEVTDDMLVTQIGGTRITRTECLDEHECRINDGRATRTIRRRCVHRSIRRAVLSVKKA